MNQNEFFNTLMDGLKDLPEIKLQEIISYYENSFTVGLAAGKTEEEIVNELDNPTLIVTKYRKDDFATPINSESITDNVDITPISPKISINDSNPNNNNFINNDTTFNKKQNIVTDTNDIVSDFKTNDKFNNNNSNKINFEGNNKSTAFETSNCYEDINSNDSKCKFSNEVSLNLHKNNSNNNSSYTSNNSNFNNTQNKNSNSNNFNDQNPKNKFSHFNVNTILKICIAILSLIIFFPVITGVIGCVIGLFGVAISILVASIGVLISGTLTSFIGLPNIPMFVSNFPYPVLLLFSLGSILLSILLIILFCYLCKFFIQLSIKLYNSLKPKGGEF